MRLLAAIPALPVRNVPIAIEFYQRSLGFEPVHVDGGFAIMRRDDVEIHLWEADSPHTPGAEPYLAGSASCRVWVNGLGALYDEYRTRGVIHPNGSLTSRPWGDDDFTILDADGNAIAFFEPSAT
jgi:catechol 2,3-dioxygenase-like lactoylglutathione lyase family enzyme